MRGGDYAPHTFEQVVIPGCAIESAAYFEAVDNLTSSGESVWFIQGPAGKERGTLMLTEQPSQWPRSVIDTMQSATLNIRYDDGGN